MGNEVESEKALIKRYVIQTKRLKKLGMHPANYWERKRVLAMYQETKTKAMLLGIALPVGAELNKMVHSL